MPIFLIILLTGGANAEAPEQKQKEQIESPQHIEKIEMVEVPKLIPKVPYNAPMEVTDAKSFIYNKESSNNPASVNSGGCIGLGQACPAGAKPALLLACPNWQTDYTCQDNFFTNVYMKNRYGTWENAKAFWLRNGWW